MSLEFKNRLQRWLGEELNISPQLLFEYSSICKLSEFLYLSLIRPRSSIQAPAEHKIESNKGLDNVIVRALAYLEQ